MKWNLKNVPVKDLKENLNNPRILTEKGLNDLEQSIKKFGLAEPLVVNKDMTICGGHGRKNILERLKITNVDCYFPEKQLTEKEFTELGIRLNKNIAGVFDFEKLEELINDIDLDVDLKDLQEWGFDEKELELEFEKEEITEDNYEPPPKENIKTDIIVGDLFEIGDHRLLCGDSTVQAQVDKLMIGKKADMVFTDPPYGVGYQPNMRTKSEKFEVLKNDEKFITGWINHLSLYSNGFVEPIGELSNLIIWDKGGGGIGDLKKTFLTDFEIALVYNRDAEIIGKRLGSVWNVNKDSSTKYLHPTQKPIELAGMAIENILEKNKICLDLFSGSGSTMAACHQLNRKCYGMELDPKYCQVIIDRMKKLDPNIKINKIQ
jgi:DNA modification methylase